MTTRPTIALVAALLLFTSPLHSATPDQVLVIYNADWDEDIHGTEPGQDSLEVARYYVAAHTDPKTGKKPYLLGLRNLDPKRDYLGVNDPKESSDDNPWGLKYLGAAPVRIVKRPPRAAGAGYGDRVPGNRIEKASTRAEYAVLFLPMKTLAAIRPGSERLMLRREGQAPRELFRQRPGPGNVPWFRHPVRGRGMYVFTMLRGRVEGEVTLSFEAARKGGGDAIGWSQEFAVSDDLKPAEHKPEIPRGGGFAPRLASSESLRRLDGELRFTGFTIRKKDWNSVDREKLTITLYTGADGTTEHTLIDAGEPADGVGYDVWPVKRGDRFVTLTLPPAMRPTGYYAVEIAAPKKNAAADDEPTILRRDEYLPKSDVAFDETGPDNRRDDRDYLDHIETPIKQFLEDPANALPDGTLLKDHILYIAVCYGLPYRVATLYGITRGEPGNGFHNMGRGCALTQRLSIMYLKPAVTAQPAALRDRGVTTTRLVATPTLMVRSAGTSPYVLPGVFQPNAPLPKSLPRFSTELRARQPESKFLYGASRVDGPTPHHAKAMVDAALYASKHFTPKLGGVSGASYRTAAQAAELARSKGFDVPQPWSDQPAVVDRSLVVMGLFGYGPAYLGTAKPVKRRDDSAVHFAKGFKPGGWGYSVRSFLGWKHERTPSQFGRYIRKMLEGGSALSCGAVGGAHDTSHSRFDDRMLFHLLTSGHEYGEATLRATMYWHWVIEYFGDPLYTADLSKTTVPDPIALKDKEAVSVEWVPTMDGACAIVSVDIGHTFATPQFATVRAELWPVDDPDDKTVVADPLFATRPEVALSGLDPETDYRLRVVVTDPYGNAFDTAKAFGPIETASPAPGEAPKLVVHQTYEEGAGRDLRRLQPWGHELAGLTRRGTIEVTFVAPDHEKTASLVRGSSSWSFNIRRGSHVQGLLVGGAKAACLEAVRKGKTVSPFVPGETVTLRAWWRKHPTTRQIALVRKDGTLVHLGANNRFGWKDLPPPKRLEVGAQVRSIKIWNDAAGPTPEGYRLYPERVEYEAVQD